LQAPRAKPDESLEWASFVKNLRGHLLFVPLILYFVAFDLFSANGMKVAYEDWLLVPWTVFLRDMIVSVIVNDTGFYWGHRALHTSWLYHIHKQHHQFKQPVPHASEWAHPVEDLLCNILPTVLGCLLMGSHLYVLALFVALRVWKTCDAHCGYNLPFPFSIWHGLPGMLGSDMHDFHHESKQGMDSCFGAMTTFWDYVMGTDRNFYKSKLKREGKQQEQQQEHEQEQLQTRSSPRLKSNRKNARVI
jgi:sterol desaturase/sphingolipid hydroxylase (fatty acid hydroxylase superfamily)